ncbi:Lnt Apolipoprotein N-acyltransferase [Candidatus Nanopelagicaceae bacterium]
MVIAPFLYTAIAGLFFAVSFKPFGLWFAAPIAFAILFHQLRTKSHPLAHSLLFAFVANLVILSWTSTFVGSIPWLLLVLLQALYFLPLGIAAHFIRSVPVFIFITLASESLKARFPFGGFSWTKVAFSQVDSPLAPLVSTFGIATLSLLTLLISYTLILRSKTLALVLISFIVIAHFVNVQPLSSTSIYVRAIQGGVPERGLDFNARAMAVLDNHVKKTLDDVNGEEELIIWPENAIDVDPLQNQIVAQKITSLAEQTGIPLLAGAILDDKELLNSTILFDEAGKPTSIYIKRYLTPFGEYIPLRSIAQVISSDANRVTDFSPGENLVVHKVNGTSIGSIICYEILNDGLVREVARESSLLVVHTNSATFSGSAEGEQQLAITRLRAMESKKMIVSISTTGPSAIIDARGEVLEKLQDGEVGSLASVIPTLNNQTLSMRLGGFAELVVLFSCALWALFSLRKGRKK